MNRSNPLEAQVQTEAAMIRVKIEYDKYNRTFKLMDKECGPLLEDGDVYVLLVPARVKNDDEAEKPLFEGSTLAHA
jgi:hypothetical protein